MSGTPQEPAAEPSMEEILSSIRRILKDDETITMPAGSSETAKPVLSLDTSMMVDEGKASSTAQAAPIAAGDAAAASPTLSTAPPPGTPAGEKIDAAAVAAAGTLVGSQTAQAAASHIGALVRTISADRSATVSRSGVTIEDLVREEIRPLLKDWLDAHLPGLVERIVRAEIERLVGRGAL